MTESELRRSIAELSASLFARGYSVGRAARAISARGSTTAGI